ncbi:MAG: Capsular polysaccharide biosynthesis protein [Candidatus Woesebacteria bacterium GW2011_GWA1_39_21]|uniref:Capsular polysaccharide biosynthesis protein n=1 Tax=Candidatus Woesebacteria bacterium GW2011_GWA1_39_21 TaxID=1618550 RepID=A0A0G0NF70_9BACT|nr:MAG: Capsular polysaccharide biosynthesis protein [Candidatus Woesebacteria bacterium GW2011_GWA1_39_21]
MFVKNVMKEKIINANVKILNHSFSPKKIFLHPLFSGSFFMVVGSNLANFLAYIYHLILGRLLGPDSYGELVATISLIGLIMSLVSFFGLVIVKFVSSSDKKDTPAILEWFNNKVIKVSLGVSVVILLISSFLGDYIHIGKNISLLFAPILFFSMIIFVYKSLLQGVVKFKETVIIGNIELLGRLAFGLALYYLGFGVFGAILGMLLAEVVALVLSRFFLRDIGFVKSEVKNFNFQKVFSYALPVFVVSVSFTSLLTSDLVLVKHFFSSHDAGIYGSISNLGKVIFYGTAPIGAVMFPLIAKKKSTNSSYLEGGRYLLLMGLYFVIYSLANLFSSFMLSIDLTRPLLLVPVFAIMQVLMIYLFHSSFWYVIGSSLLCISLLVIYLGLYFAYVKKKTF